MRARDGSFTTFDVESSGQVYVVGMSGKGVIMGFYYPPDWYHGFVWDAHGAIATFDAPGSIAALPTSINGEGTIAGYFFDPGFQPGTMVLYATPRAPLPRSTRPMLVSLFLKVSIRRGSSLGITFASPVAYAALCGGPNHVAS